MLVRKRNVEVSPSEKHSHRFQIRLFFLKPFLSRHKRRRPNPNEPQPPPRESHVTHQTTPPKLAQTPQCMPLSLPRPQQPPLSHAPRVRGSHTSALPTRSPRRSPLGVQQQQPRPFAPFTRLQRASPRVGQDTEV